MFSVIRKTLVPLCHRGSSIGWFAWWAVSATSLVGVVFLGVGAWRALNHALDETATASAAMYTLLETGSVLEREIARTVQPAIKRTEILAKNSALIQATSSGNRAVQTSLLNSKIATATEIDAIALFNSAGQITAINSFYANGQRIPNERVNRVLGADFSRSQIVQSCLRNSSTSPVLEFQTHCDITPAFFDSTGLSVAYSVPIIDPSNGAKIGVISSRLRFERLGALIEGRTIAGGSAKAFFVTDAGEYFSEAINSGREHPPVPVVELRNVVRSILSDPAAKTITKRADEYLAIFSLQGIQTLKGGGIHVLIVADSRWLTQGPRQARLIEAGGRRSSAHCC